jgi:hypothetical protein
MQEPNYTLIDRPFPAIKFTRASLSINRIRSSLLGPLVRNVGTSQARRQRITATILSSVPRGPRIRSTKTISLSFGLKARKAAFILLSSTVCLPPAAAPQMPLSFR